MVSLKYCILATEGVHDQAAISRVLKLSGLKRFGGQANRLDAFWQRFIPIYPKRGNLYDRLSMPSIYSSSTHSVAIYQGGGSELLENLQADILYEPYHKDIHAFGVIVDTDTYSPSFVCDKYAKGLRGFFPDIPDIPNVVDIGPPRTGLYILPDNINSGVLDTLLVKCAAVMYPDHAMGAENFLNQLGGSHKTHWGPFDYQKALVATITSVLRPGATNTASIAQDNWICEKSKDLVIELSSLANFINNLLEI